VSDGRSTRKRPSILLVVLIILGLLYAPLVASLLENRILGSDHVYDFFDSIGLADPLDVIYSPVVELFDELLQ